MISNQSETERPAAGVSTLSATNTTPSLVTKKALSPTTRLPGSNTTSAPSLTCAHSSARSHKYPSPASSKAFIVDVVVILGALQRSGGWRLLPRSWPLASETLSKSRQKSTHVFIGASKSVEEPIVIFSNRFTSGRPILMVDGASAQKKKRSLKLRQPPG